MAMFFFFLIALTLFSTCMTQETKQTYIVHMNHNAKPSLFSSHHDWYSSTLRSLPSNNNDVVSLLYTYNQAFHGFAASLTPKQADTLRMSNAILDVYEDTVYALHTTRSPEFLGIQSELGLWDGNGDGIQGVKNQAQAQATAYDVIVGVLDTGVWPESLSFDDSGMPRIPARWRGKCEPAPDFSPKLCNKKLIGARSFSKGYQMASGASVMEEDHPVSPRDYEGHGTHTASTAAGARVVNASMLGYASGTARGMAAHARVAAYKVCWPTGCFGSDILAGMEQAIADGVDVLSLSLGGGAAPYYRDTVAIGAFAAMAKGIFVSCSAGNSGPKRSSLANVAPWIMTVGAGTLDRDFPAYAILGNKKRFAGVSLYSGTGMGGRLVGLVYKGANSSSNLCLPGSLDKSVKGKVVLCDRGVNARAEKGVVVRDAGGIGMILANTAESGEELVADSHLLPAVTVGRKVGDEIREYVKNEAKPMALLRFGGTVLNVKPSPVVAAFSSRGPNMVNPQILKPDVIGPGVNILAAWSEAVGPTALETDTRKTKFNILSGTSMSCPHISGVAALLKAAHPDWSPSAIKSALMTTAYTVDNTKSALRDAADGSLSTPWAHGAGHVDPQKALSPGLIYDISTEEYITFLCTLGYTIEHIQAITKQPDVTCASKYADPGDLNYPSFSVVFGGKRVVRYTRTLTNVGAARVAYRVNVTAPDSVSVKVRPSMLTFRSVGEKKRYKVTFTAKKGTKVTAKSQFGSIVWKNTHNQVTSPVAFSWRYFF